MAVIAVTSAKGSPGVTTTCLAMTLAWPRPVLLVEADPAGGDILAGYLRGQLAMDRGLVGASLAARHHRLAEDFNTHLLDLAKPNSPVSRVLLPGLSDPAQAATVAPMWDVLAAHFTRLAHGDSDSDIIVDCGRLATNYPPLHVMAVADAVLLVVRATLRSASTATSAIAAARVGLGTTADERLGLIVVDSGEYKGSELGKALRAPVVATMPWRPSEAAALSDGVGRVSGSSALLRAARSIDRPIRARIAGRSAPEESPGGMPESDSPSSVSESPSATGSPSTTAASAVSPSAGSGEPVGPSPTPSAPGASALPAVVRHTPSRQISAGASR
ncbi:MAG TPA: ParA family protein [Micromonosporaceae bacterium]